MHSIHYIGSSGIVVTECEEIRGSMRDNYNWATEDDEKVDCLKCLKVMEHDRPKVKEGV